MPFESMPTDIAKERTEGKASPGDRFDGMTSEEFAEFIEAHNWVFARTMPQWPHEYLVRKRVP